MKLKIGTKLICKMDLYHWDNKKFHANETYFISNIEDNLYIINGFKMNFNSLKYHFNVNKEIRRLKLKKINGVQ